MSSSDILRKLETREIVELKDYYANVRDEVPHVFSFLKSALKWRQTHPEYITIFSVDGDWRCDGTFIALLTFSCYDIFLHSCEETSTKLFKGLSQTKQIKWSDYPVLYYAVHEKLKSIIYKAMDEINVTIDEESPTYLWQLMEKDGLQLPIRLLSDDFYLDRIKPEDAEVINEMWPPKYNGSLEYLRTFIKMNGGYGIYEKSTGKLVSWILYNVLGQLGVLQTKNGYFKKGFASAVTVALSRTIAENGDHPIGTVHDGNVASETLFHNLGFVKKFKCIYIQVKQVQQN